MIHLVPGSAISQRCFAPDPSRPESLQRARFFDSIPSFARPLSREERSDLIDHLGIAGDDIDEDVA